MTFEAFATNYFALVKEMFAEDVGERVPGTILTLASLEPDSAMNRLADFADAHPVFNARVEDGEGMEFA